MSAKPPTLDFQNASRGAPLNCSSRRQEALIVSRNSNGASSRRLLHDDKQPGMLDELAGEIEELGGDASRIG